MFRVPCSTFQVRVLVPVGASRFEVHDDRPNLEHLHLELWNPNPAHELGTWNLELGTAWSYEDID